MRTRRVILQACLLACTALGASTHAAEPVVDVEIRDYKFHPETLTIKAVVRWTNREKRTSHSVLFPDAGGFESARMFPDESWQRRFDRAGAFSYTCGPHPEMKGRIVVTD